MSLRSGNALIEGIVWSLVLVIFFFLFFQGDNAVEWGEDKTRRFLSAILFAVGFFVHFVMLFRNRKEVVDERATKIQEKSTSITLVVTSIYVFVVCITLFTYYEDDVFVPVAWFWFVGYTSIFVTYIVNSFLYYIIEKTGITYEN